MSEKDDVEHRAWAVAKRYDAARNVLELELHPAYQRNEIVHDLAMAIALEVPGEAG